MYKNFGKRFIDVIMAAAGLIILSPLFLFITVLIFFSDHQYPFFYQRRPGLDGKIFVIVKFKTMKEDQDRHGKSLSDHERTTHLGGLLRKTSLDELPQLWNVLIGNMSLIGPRPLLSEYLPHYNEYQFKRHSVKPGITGWAQIHGRNRISWREKFDLDIWYVNNFSLLIDLNIIVLTLKNVVFQTDIDSSKDQFIEKFNG